MMERLIIKLSWKSPEMPAQAYKYYHAGCYNDCKQESNGEKSELSREEIALYTTCSYCGWYLKF